MNGSGKLKGVRVVVTRARFQAPELGTKLEAEAAEVIYLPTVEIRDPDDWEPLDSALRSLVEGGYKWLLVASVNAAERVVSRVAGMQIDLAAERNVNIGAVGPAARRVLESAGIAVDLVPPRFTGADFARALGTGSGRILLPRVAGGPREIVEALESRGWTVDEVTAYINVVPEARGEGLDRVRAGEFDVVTFLSPSAATNFVKLLGPPDKLGLAPGTDTAKAVACIGPKTGKRLTELGFRIDVTPEEHTAESLVGALAKSLS